MDIVFKIKHYTNKVLLTFLGPAQLDEENDPVAQLDREWAERFDKADLKAVDGSGTESVPTSGSTAA
jgi:hypothetical protein